MDANDLLLMYMPYCVYKKITVCLDEAIKKHPEFLSQHKGKENKLSSPGVLLFDELSRKSWTCHNLKVEIESYGDDDISKSFQTSVNVIGDKSQNGEQSLLSQNLALQDHVDELGLQLRLQEQHIKRAGHQEHLVPLQRGSHVYRSPSPINCIEEDPDDIEFG